jgi:hypothetical protein
MRRYIIAALALVLLTRMTAPVSAQKGPGQREVTLDINVFEGDPKGSRAKGTIRLLARPRITTLEDRPACTRLGSSSIVEGKYAVSAAFEGMTFLPSRMPDGKIRLEVDSTLAGAEPRRVVRTVKSGQEVKVELGKTPSGDMRWAVIKVEAEPRLVDQHKDLVPSLLAGARKSDRKEVREAVIEAIRALGADAVPTLMEELQSKDNGRRAAAAMLLGQVAGNGQPLPEAIPALLKLARDEDADVSEQAVIALSRIIKAAR